MPGSAPENQTPLPPLRWSVHRLRESPAKSLLASFFVLAFIVFSVYAFGPLLALVAVAVFAAALNTWYLPVRYVLDRDGVTVDKRVFSYTYPWEQFRRWFRTSNGVVLSPFARRTFLDTFRGVHLLLPADPGPVFAYLACRLGDEKLAPPHTGARNADAAALLDTREATDKMDTEEPES
ncbi:MAG TPA: hypothetical protein ENN51_01270 [candidate division WOR-3 bacterium]|uniref:PH domain-containing protein n=1 Tax=candidate division WOR-3 bacterium TaxID=2052148 RepID=A0A7V0T4B1_UNCW3|nr:hypothetical protein [candidate division WOR-3 bacterium]